MTTVEQAAATSPVVGLEETIASDPAQVGTKAATLARLAGCGFPVPEGFVITASASDRISASGEVPQALWAEVLLHLERLGAAAVAVRSSGVAEDLADASYAGQYDTVLGVEGPEALADAVRRCLASATSDRLRAYRASPERPRMAVLIQRMVDAEAAGVAFTANPVTGNEETLVNAVKGLGDRLVSGEATPDEWVVRGTEVSCVRRTDDALSREQARDVADMAAAVARFFGAPQDIEWAVSGQKLFLLQARPITALPVAPRLEVPADGFWQKDTSHFPAPLTPFGASIYLPALSRAFDWPAQEFGLMIDGVEQRSLGGEVYMHVIPPGGKHRPAPPPWAMWLAFRLAPPLRRRARAAQAAIASKLPERILESWEAEWRPAFAREFGELMRVDLAALDDGALLGQLDRATDLLRRGIERHFQLVVPYYLAVYQLSLVCRELLGWDAVQALSLVTGTSSASSEPGRALLALARRIAADAPARQAISEPGGDRRQHLRQSAPWAADALDEYLDRYGHRTVNLDPGAPTWFERPETVAGLLAEQVRNLSADSGERDEQPAALVQARVEVTKRSEGDRLRFEQALASAQRAYAMREDNVVWLDSQPSALVRYCAVEMGRRLAERGALRSAEDAVFLEESELRDAVSGAGGEDLRGLVTRRKAERAWVSAHPGPVSYGVDPGPPPEDLSPLPAAVRLVNAATIQVLQLMATPSKPQDASDQLRGVPGSPGRYSGRVRVIRDETEFAKLCPGDVLVAPVTSPPWSVLFLNAGAVVTDGGGVLSHTAVVAREYGIPAVLATGEATSRLRDGDLVLVDGSSGVVSRASPNK